jgi:hypothetical protein
LDVDSVVTDNLSLTTVKSHPHHQALSGPLMGMRMPIYRLLKDTAFEPEAAEAMGRAYEDLLGDLGIADRSDPFTEIIAKRVIEVASTSVHNPIEIRK